MVFRPDCAQKMHMFFKIHAPGSSDTEYKEGGKYRYGLRRGSKTQSRLARPAQPWRHKFALAAAEEPRGLKSKEGSSSEVASKSICAEEATLFLLALVSAAMGRNCKI